MGWGWFLAPGGLFLVCCLVWRVPCGLSFPCGQEGALLVVVGGSCWVGDEGPKGHELGESASGGLGRGGGPLLPQPGATGSSSRAGSDRHRSFLRA